MIVNYLNNRQYLSIFPREGVQISSRGKFCNIA